MSVRSSISQSDSQTPKSPNSLKSIISPYYNIHHNSYDIIISSSHTSLYITLQFNITMQHNNTTSQHNISTQHHHTHQSYHPHHHPFLFILERLLSFSVCLFFLVVLSQFYLTCVCFVYVL